MLHEIVWAFVYLVIAPLIVGAAAAVWIVILFVLSKVAERFEPPHPEVKTGDCDIWPEMSPRLYVDQDRKGWIGSTLVIDMSK